jgi:alanine racemase
MLSMGYSDGLRRELSSTNARPGGWVMLRGRDGTGRQAESQPAKAEPQAEKQAAKRAPIVGRVSMNLTMVDVTAVDDVRVGDEVVLLGDGVTADDHARLAQTIPYEILCGVRRDSCEV